MMFGLRMCFSTVGRAVLGTVASSTGRQVARLVTSLTPARASSALTCLPTGFTTTTSVAHPFSTMMGDRMYNYSYQNGKPMHVNGSLLQECLREGPLFSQPKRNNIKFSYGRGKRKTVKAVVMRFFRLHWGGWIHTMPGRHKRLWKKSWQVKQRMRRHIFCDSSRSKLFDHMVTRFWKRPRYYPDDPYEPYHVRNNCPYNLYHRR